MIARDKQDISGKTKLITIKPEREESELSYFLSKGKSLNVFKSRRKKSKGLTAM